MSSSSLLEVRDLSVVLGRAGHRGRAQTTKAIDGVDLTVARGEILALAGESGCGKTTLGRTILGLQREAGGAISFEGRRVDGLAPAKARQARRAIQYMHQDAAAALDPWWTIGATLDEALRILGLKAPAARAARLAEALDQVGLDGGVGRRYPHELSGGQLRRVALARVLLMAPRLLVLDEPTAGLDLSVQATVLNLLLGLRDRLDMAYLFISHDLAVVERVADRVAIMQAGRIVECGPTSVVFAQPQHPYTRSLMETLARSRAAFEAFQPSIEPPDLSLVASKESP